MMTARTLDEARSAMGSESNDDLGERELEPIYRLHAADVSRWIRRLWPAGDTTDLLHDVFLVAQRKLSGFRGEASVRTWLYAITVRVVSARRRRERLRRMLWLRGSHELAAGRAPPETPLGAAERRDATHKVYAVLDHLSERDRTLLVLFELEGLDAEEIAAIVGITTNNTWVGLYRARARFRSTFSKLFGDEGESHGESK